MSNAALKDSSPTSTDGELLSSEAAGDGHADPSSEEASTAEHAGSTTDVESTSDDEVRDADDEPVIAPLPPSERRSRRASTAMVIIAVLGGLYTVYFAKTILMPVVAGIILALLLRPLVRRMRRYRLADSLSAAIVLSAVVIIAFGAFINLLGPARMWLDNAPSNFRTVGEKLNVLREQVSDLNRASKVVEDLARGDMPEDDAPKAPFPFAPEPSPEEAADGGASATAVEEIERGSAERERLVEAADTDEEPIEDEEVEEPIAVEIRQPRLVAGFNVISSTGSVLAGVAIALVLAYFLLASGDVLINNVLRILPSMREKRNAVELVHNVERGISSYLLTVTAINICLGIVIWIAMWLLALPNPMLWGAMATVFNFVPILGAMCGTIVVFLVSVLSFDTLSYAFVPPLVFLSITSLEGNFITPYILGRSMSLNPIMVFLALAIWGWMWGVGGAFLAVPILAILKVGFDQFDRTRPLGTLLGGDPQG